MQQTDLLFYRFRFVLAGILVIAFCMGISALVTAIGSNSILDARTAPPAPVVNLNVGDDPNVVTATAFGLIDGTKRVSLAAGTAIYGMCRSITMTTSHTGTSVGHGVGSVVGGIGNGVTLVGRGIGHGVASTVHAIGSGTMFVLHLPGRAVGSITNAHTVSALIRPADEKKVPVIDGETSAEVIASLNAQQQAEISKLLEAQIAANRGLGGSVVAGDAAHGGYPAKWDNARQDSQIDSWGMYSRECVSYAAWKVYQTYGSMPYWGGVGNANQWVRNARRAGIPTSSVPKVHSVAISMQGYYGHAMWVEKVSGNMIYVSQYNYDLHGHYSEMWLDGRSLTYIYFQ